MPHRNASTRQAHLFWRRMRIPPLQWDTSIIVTGHTEFTFNSTETRAWGTEMKSRDEADEVLGIERLRFSFHQIIKELLTCQIPRGHRLRPPGTFPPGLWSIYPHIALNGSGCDAGVSTATSRLHGAYCLLIGLLLPPLLFSTEQPGCLL